MRRVFSVVCALAMVVAASAAAQSKPSFAGKWTLVPDPNAAQGAGRGRGGFGGLGQEFTAEQNDKTLTVTTTNAQLGEMKMTYNLDGTETKNPLSFQGTSIDRMSKVKWDGAKLVITTTTDFNGNSAESTQSWSLDGSGGLVIETTSNFGGNPQTAKATYKKG